MNSCIFLGRITKEPTIRQTQNGGIVYNVSIAVNRKFKRENEPEADFINIISFGKIAEFMQKYMSIKGQQILVETHLQNRSWDDENGQKHYITEFIVDNCYFADTKKDNQTQNAVEGVVVNTVENGAQDNDLPF